MPGYMDEEQLRELNQSLELDEEHQARHEEVIGRLFELKEEIEKEQKMVDFGLEEKVVDMWTGKTAGGCARCDSYNEGKLETHSHETINLDELAAEFHDTAVEKGFWDDVDKITDATSYNYGDSGYEDIDARNSLMHLLYGNKRDLIHTEVAELTEAVRKEQGDEKELDEAADIIIRLLDHYEGRRRYSGVKGSLQEAVMKKAAKNRERPRKHGNLF